ncbi:unnamed protein product, partial [Medioppia subpectinata]
ILNTSVSSDDLNSQTKEIEDILIDNEYDNSNGSVTSLAVRTVFPIFQHMIEFKVFNDLELNRLLELFTATNIFVTGPLYPWIKTEITDISQLSPFMPNFLINSIKTTIHFAKNLSSCQELYGDDRKYLVKYGYSDVRTMRSLFYYNFEQQYWTVNTHHQTAIIMPLKVFEIRGEYYHRLKAFYDTLDTEWDRDHVVLDLLTAIAFFNPNRPKLYRKEIVKFQQYIYMYLLQRYLLIKCGSETESQERFAKLMANMNELEIMGELRRKYGYKERKKPTFRCNYLRFV